MSSYKKIKRNFKNSGLSFLDKSTPYGIFETADLDYYLIGGDLSKKYAILLDTERFSTIFSAFELKRFPDDIGTYLGPACLLPIGLEEYANEGDVESDLGLLRIENSSVQLMCGFPGGECDWIPIGIYPTIANPGSLLFNRWALSVESEGMEFIKNQANCVTYGIDSQYRLFCPEKLDVDLSSVDVEAIHERGLALATSPEPAYFRPKP